jgi:hypothetical protein
MAGQSVQKVKRQQLPTASAVVGARVRAGRRDRVGIAADSACDGAN